MVPSSSAICVAVLLALAAPFAAALELPGSRSAAHALLSDLISKSSPSKDAFALLSEKQKGAWGYDDSRTINETIAAVTSVPVELIVDLRLVGFDGDGHSGINIPALLLLKYLSALHGELDTVALLPQLRSLLPLAPHVTFRVTHAPRALREAIDTALAAHFLDAREHPERHTASPMLQVPFRDLDVLLHTDWHNILATPTFTLYLLNPLGEGRDRQHVYSYDEPPPPKIQNGKVQAASEPDTRASSCPGSLWSATQPYAWIDITAGPLVYGPGLGHQGQVLAHSLPRPEVYRGEAVSKAIVPDLAALVWSACKHLVWPPIHSAELQYHEEVVVQVIHMHDTLSPPSRHLDASVLLQQLRAAVPEVVEVKEVWLSFADCDLCVAALTGATKLRTARDLTSEVQSTTRAFLDRLLLHDMMARYKDRIFSYKGIPTEDKTATTDRHILPVFIFDLSQEDILLLDDESRATAFPDMVLAVATKRASPVETHFSCAYHRVELDGKDITREVLAATLQAGWGVAHTAAYHSRATGENANYLWSVGNTPFGPFSGLATLSATQAQAAARNHVAILLDNSTRRVEDVMQAFHVLCPKGHVSCALDNETRKKVRRRLNIFEWKVKQAAAKIAAWDAQGALPFARSATHDVAALEQLGAYGTRGQFDTTLDCEGHVTTYSFFLYPSLAMISWLLAMALRLRISKPKAHKQY